MTPVVLVGLMGAGKTTVGRCLAVRGSARFFDLDAHVEQRSDMTISEIFEREREAGFRTRETGALLELLSDAAGCIIALGGGAVLSEVNRNALALSGAIVVYLKGSPAELAARIAGDTNRPLLGEDAEISLTHLLDQREPLYARTADVVVDVDGRIVEQVVDEVAGAVGIKPMTDGDVHYEPVKVGGGRDYVAHVGSGVRHHLAEVVPPTCRRVAVLTQAHLHWTVDPGREHRVFDVPDGEAAKSLSVVADICGELARWGLTRNDVVVTVGGGVVTDLGGFVASVYHRGVRVIHVPTTLLGQIDAAIGGKCGVNLPEGKNLVGSFWQPSAVLCDTETLSTLPAEDFAAGLGELAKYHFLGAGHLDQLELPARVAACVRLKADIVGQDELEQGRRAILNYGHTLAHALETATGFEIRHGLAVATGLPYAAEVARLLGRIDRDRVHEHFRVLDAYGLTARIPDGIDRSDLIDLFGRDKKAVDGITFVLDGPNGVEPVTVEDRDVLLAAFEVFER